MCLSVVTSGPISNSALVAVLIGSSGPSATTSMHVCGSEPTGGVHVHSRISGRSGSVAMVWGVPTGVQFASPALFGHADQKSAGRSGSPAEAGAVMIFTVTLLAGSGPRL